VPISPDDSGRDKLANPGGSDRKMPHDKRPSLIPSGSNTSVMQDPCPAGVLSFQKGNFTMIEKNHKFKLKGKAVKFEAKDFVASNSATAEDKAKWANKFVKFILGGFQSGSFNKDLYGRLRAMFGHCAEYDIHGFYFVWFDDAYKCLHWVETVTTSWLCGVGNPAFTWSDVEIVLIKWLKESNIHDQIARYMQAETEEQERAQLTALKLKYEASADEPATAHPIPLKIIVPSSVQETEQMRLF
jgi:hypothetical protein